MKVGSFKDPKVSVKNPVEERALTFIGDVYVVTETDEVANPKLELL